MSGAEQALATLRDFVERSTHWQEGGATRHDALKVALPALEAALQDLNADAEPVGSILKGNLKPQQEPWCREVLLYSPENQGDNPENRVMLYTGGRLGDALEWAEKGLAEWRSRAQSNGKQAEMARATARIAIGHLQAMLHKCRTADDQLKADSAARDWLVSIGAEPE